MTDCNNACPLTSLSSLLQELLLVLIHVNVSSAQKINETHL